MPKTSMHADASPEIFETANKLRQKRTNEEIKLWIFLKTKPLGFKFRQQHPFGRYILDFYCHAAQMSIEIDGINHFQEVQKENDRLRTQFINSMSIEELRFTNDEINTEFEMVCKKIEIFLESRLGPNPKE